MSWENSQSQSRLGMKGLIARFGAEEGRERDKLTFGLILKLPQPTFRTLYLAAWILLRFLWAHFWNLSRCP